MSHARTALVAASALLLAAACHQSAPEDDSGRLRRCVETMGESRSLPYADLSGCEDPDKSLRLYAQTVNEQGSYCTDAQGRHLLSYNGPQSNLRFDWLDGPPAAVELALDFGTRPHPCGARYFTINQMIVDGASGPLPHPRELLATFGTFQHSSNAGALGDGSLSRGYVTWVGGYDGQTFAVEVNLTDTDAWDPPGAQNRAGRVRKRYNDVSWANVYLELRGAQLPAQLVAGASPLRIEWCGLIPYLIAHGDLPAPRDWAAARTGSVFFGVEGLNGAAADSLKSSVRVSDLRIDPVGAGGSAGYPLPIVPACTVTQSHPFALTTPDAVGTAFEVGGNATWTADAAGLSLSTLSTQTSGLDFVSRRSFDGELDVELELSPPTFTTAKAGGGAAGLKVYDSSGQMLAALGLVADASRQTSVASVVRQGATYQVPRQLVLPSPPAWVRLRIERCSGVLSFYQDAGAGYVLHSSMDLPAWQAVKVGPYIYNQDADVGLRTTIRAFTASDEVVSCSLAANANARACTLR